MTSCVKLHVVGNWIYIEDANFIEKILSKQSLSETYRM